MAEKRNFWWSKVNPQTGPDPESNKSKTNCNILESETVMHAKQQIQLEFCLIMVDANQQFKSEPEINAKADFQAQGHQKPNRNSGLFQPCPF